MMRHTARCLFLCILLLAVSCRGGAGEQGLVSTMSLMAAVSDAAGITIVPAEDVPVNVYTEDYGPSQVLEIIRPGMGPVSVGRLNSSCACVQASLPKRDFAQDERILIEIRNVKATPAAGATYAVFVQLTSPVAEVLQYDLFVQSDRTPSAAPAAAAPAASAAPSVPAGHRPTTVLQGADERGVLVIKSPVQAYPRGAGQPNTRYENVVPYTPRSGK